jgi:branched-chain amino acid transport system substrate-binding protein
MVEEDGMETTSWRRRVVTMGALAVAILGVAACGAGGGGGGGAKVPSTLTIYASLPFEGSSRHDTLILRHGEELALKEAGGRAGKFKINYKPLSDASTQTGNWDVGQVSANARQALSDPSTIAYLGEFNSGATAISLPILNRGSIPQVTQSSSTGLTVKAPGTEPGEPQKYYPTGVRNIVRMTSRDDAQGVGLAQLAKQAGATKLAVLNDKEVYGLGLGASVERSAKQLGLAVVVSQGVDPKAPNYRSLAGALASKGVDAVVFAGCTGNNAVQLFKDLSSALPQARLYGGDCLLDGVFYAKKGGIPEGVQRKTILTAQLLPPDQLTAEGRAVLERYKSTYGGDLSAYAVYGYESMKLILDSIKAVGPTLESGATIRDFRKALVDYIYHRLGTRQSALGRYKVDVNGDASIPQLAAYKLHDGETVFYKDLKPSA